MPSVSLNNLQLAWAAGFFDGEGSVHRTYRCYKNKKKYEAFQVSIGQSGYTKPAVLSRFRRAIGIGKIYGPYGPYGNKMPQWQYEVNGVEKIAFIYGLLQPWLSKSKRAQFKKVLRKAG